jgi:hypothetical protein
LSVVSDHHLCGIEVSEILSLGVGFHGANRSDHALSLQVIFSVIPHYSLGFRRCFSAYAWAGADGLLEYHFPELRASSISAASSGGIGMLLNGATFVPPVFP